VKSRPSEDCCSFGDVFDSTYDEKFASLKVREAAEYFDALSLDRRITRHLIEMHRMCLDLSKPQKMKQKVLAFSDDLKEVAETNRREITPEEKKEAVVKTFASVEGMTPAEIEEEQRINTIITFVNTDSWKGLTTVRACKNTWKCSSRTVYRYMEKARERLAEGRGSVLFGREVSIRKTASIRDAALEEKDWRGAMAAQKHIDQISGVLAPPSVQINQQINIATHPAFRQTLDQIFTEIADELEEYPELLERVYVRLSNRLASIRNSIPGDGALLLNAVDTR
jgi:hypothetical protein